MTHWFVRIARAHGTEDADDPILLALEPLSLDLRNAPDVGVLVGARTDLLWFLIDKRATDAGIAREAIVNNLREHVLPRVYPEAYGACPHVPSSRVMSPARAR